MKRFPLISFVFISLIFVNVSAHAYIGGRQCVPADAKARLFRNASGLESAMADLKQNGDRVIDSWGGTPPSIDYYQGQKYIFWGKTVRWKEYNPGKPDDTFYYQSDLVKAFKKDVMADVKELKIEYSSMESWENMLNRILGRGEFADRPMVTSSDYRETCDLVGIP